VRSIIRPSADNSYLLPLIFGLIPILSGCNGRLFDSRYTALSQKIEDVRQEIGEIRDSKVAGGDIQDMPIWAYILIAVCILAVLYFAARMFRFMVRKIVQLSTKLV
jgi:hypothetical protein